MPPLQAQPTGLYIHSPWCWQKCPYCDFNAYQKPSSLSAMSLLEQAYQSALIKDIIQTQRHYPWLRTISSIYLGGGTPSLLSPAYWDRIFLELRRTFIFSKNIEITMEISPKTSLEDLQAFVNLGVNRFSVGLQSFNPQTLKLLGREHDHALSYSILNNLSKIPNIRVNTDLIYGLAEQSEEDVEKDLAIALSFPFHHLSWYELMIEPHTKFAKMPEIKASEEQLTQFETIGSRMLENWEHYEISAYCRNDQKSRHNILYWTYGDYLGIGAGAHSKISTKPGLNTRRFYKTRYPQDYLKSQREILDTTSNDALDFLLVRFRLFQPIHIQEIQVLSQSAQKILQHWWQTDLDPALVQRTDPNAITLTQLGRRSVNTLLTQFIEFQERNPKSK